MSWRAKSSPGRYQGTAPNGFHQKCLFHLSSGDQSIFSKSSFFLTPTHCKHFISWSLTRRTTRKGQQWSFKRGLAVKVLFLKAANSLPHNEELCFAAGMSLEMVGWYSSPSVGAILNILASIWHDRPGYFCAPFCTYESLTCKEQFGDAQA